MIEYKRYIKDKIIKALYKKPVLIIYGARQVGKTTLVKNLLKDFKNPLYLQCDNPIDVQKIENKGVSELVALVSNYDLVVLDEAQQINGIGTILKLLADNTSGIQYIATGSSSFELANKLNEPLTGRNRKFYMFPLSIFELVETFSKNKVTDDLSQYIMYGSYPNIIEVKSIEDKVLNLKDLAADYLYKDLFHLSDIRNPFAFQKVVQNLALRIGSEINYSDIAKDVGISGDTVHKYVDLLEKAFIIFRVRPMYKNKTLEISKSHKIYFYDNGIRNAVLGNFNPIELRDDKGHLFENFCMSEIKKSLLYTDSLKDLYFWRLRNGGEIDGIISNVAHDENDLFEIKWKDNAVVPKSFEKSFKVQTFEVINYNNVIDKISQKLNF